MHSIHGLKQVAEGESLCTRLVWLCLVLFQFSLAVFFVWSAFQDWQGNPDVTVTDLVPTQELDFPAVTICVDTEYTKFGMTRMLLNT